MEQFVESLLDDELDCLSNNIVDYEKALKISIEQKKEKRQHGAELYLEEEAEEYSADKECFVDFIIAQKINQKIETLTADETKEILTNLITKSKTDLSDKEKAELLYTIEACELHLYELNS